MKEGLTFLERLRLLAGRQRKVMPDGVPGCSGPAGEPGVDGVDEVDRVDGMEWAEWKAARARCAAKCAPSMAARWIRHLIREAGEAEDHLASEGSSEDVLAAAAMVRARWVELLRDRGYEVDEVAVPCGHELSDLREWFDKGGRL